MNNKEVPKILIVLKNKIFENLSESKKIEWNQLFVTAISNISNLSNVWPKFAHWILTDSEIGAINFASSESTKILIEQTIKLYEKMIKGKFNSSEWNDMRIAATKISDSSRSIADSIELVDAEGLKFILDACAALIPTYCLYAQYKSHIFYAAEVIDMVILSIRNANLKKDDSGVLLIQDSSGVSAEMTKESYILDKTRNEYVTTLQAEKLLQLLKESK